MLVGHNNLSLLYVVKNFTTNFPAGNFPAGNFPTGNYPAGNFPANNFPAGNFPRLVLQWQ